MNDFDDNLLDARLREVDLPADFTLQLRARLLPTPEQVDRALAATPPPRSAWLAELKQIPTDAPWEEQLRETPVPPGLAASLYRQPSVWVRLRTAAPRVERLANYAVAAGLFLCLTAGWWWAVAMAFAPRLPAPAAAEVAWLPYDGPVRLDAQLLLPAETPLAPPPAPPPAVFMPVAPAVALAAELSPVEAELPPGPVGQLHVELARGLPVWEDVVLLRWGVLGSPQLAYDALPELERASFTAARGVEPPLAPGYDRRFLLRHGFFPPLSPAAHPQLQTLTAPLAPNRPGRFEIESLLSSKRPLHSWQVRVEDFIAGMATRPLAAPRGKLALAAAGARSPFGSGEARLLEFTVAAGGQQAAHPACHLVLAIDLSASMGRAGRLSAVRSGLERTLLQLGADDRVSLVVFAEEILCQIEQAAAADREELLARFDELSPHGGTDLARGVQEAAALLWADGSRRQKRLVVLTDSHSALPDDTAQRLRAIAAWGAPHKAPWSLVDLSGGGEADPLLAELARSSGGDVRQTTDPRQVYACLLEQLTGLPAEVALEARLGLRFSPTQVAAYRLLGHEPTLLGQLAPADVDVALAAGDTARVLVEVWLQPAAASSSSQSPEIAAATLFWKDPASGRLQQVRRPVTREHLASDFMHAEPALQAAALAAEAAEQLRGSRDALRQWQLAGQPLVTWQTWDDAVRRLSPAVQSRPDVRRLRALVQTLRER